MLGESCVKQQQQSNFAPISSGGGGGARPAWRGSQQRGKCAVREAGVGGRDREHDGGGGRPGERGSPVIILLHIPTVTLHIPSIH